MIRRKRNIRFLSFVLVLAAVGTATGLLLKSGQLPHPGEEEDLPPSVSADTLATDWSQYIWPTDAGRKRTSEFAEFRRTHFHAGIDVSTNMQRGYNVFASRGGWVHSIEFEPGGYGWFLVLRHQDGFYTCYAHLDGFPDKIRNAYYKRLVSLRRSYGPVEWREGEVSVTRGEVVAFTGATGAGPPHLHFEVRDPDFNPVNPGLSPQLRPVDSLAPELLQLCVVPLDAASMVNGSWEQAMYNLRGTPGSGYTMSGAPVIRGSAGIMFRAHDRTNESTDYPTPYHLKLLVDGKPYFDSRSRIMQDSLGFSIRIDRDHQLMQKMKGEFRKLYREEGNHLWFYTDTGGKDGIFNVGALGSGMRTVTIIASDMAGNTSTLNFKMNILPLPDLRVEERSGFHRFRLSDTTGCRALKLELRQGGSWTTVREWGGAALAGDLSVADSLLPQDAMRVQLEDNTGATVTLAFLQERRGRKSTRLYTNREISQDEIIYTLRAADDFDAPPVVRIRQGARTAEGTVLPISGDRCRAVLKAWPGFAGSAEITVDYSIGGRAMQWKDSLSAFYVSATSGGSVASTDGRFLMNFKAGDVYRSLLCWVESRSVDSGQAYTVFPADEPLPGRPVVSIAVDGGTVKRFLDAGSPVRNYGLLSRASSGSLRARFGRFLGTYTVKEDVDKPKISFRHARGNVYALRISVTDDGSGIVPESVVVMLGDSVVPVEYNENLKVYVVPSDVQKRIKAGTITVTAADQMGNRATEQFTL